MADSAFTAEYRDRLKYGKYTQWARDASEDDLEALFWAIDEFARHATGREYLIRKEQLPDGRQRYRFMNPWDLLVAAQRSRSLTGDVRQNVAITTILQTHWRASRRPESKRQPQPMLTESLRANLWDDESTKWASLLSEDEFDALIWQVGELACRGVPPQYSFDDESSSRPANQERILEVLRQTLDFQNEDAKRRAEVAKRSTGEGGSPEPARRSSGKQAAVEFFNVRVHRAVAAGSPETIARKQAAVATIVMLHHRSSARAV